MKIIFIFSCSGMFRHVPECSMFRILSTPKNSTPHIRMYVQKHASEMLGKLRWFFRGKHHPDSRWSWVVCISSAVCGAINTGFVLSFGVLFPELMAHFDETTETTGEYITLHVFQLHWNMKIIISFLMLRRIMRFTVKTKTKEKRNKIVYSIDCIAEPAHICDKPLRPWIFE